MFEFTADIVFADEKYIPYEALPNIVPPVIVRPVQADPTI
jgi:hypothetical protein